MDADPTSADIQPILDLASAPPLDLRPNGGSVKAGVPYISPPGKHFHPTLHSVPSTLQGARLPPHGGQPAGQTDGVSLQLLHLTSHGVYALPSRPSSLMENSAIVDGGMAFASQNDGRLRFALGRTSGWDKGVSRAPLPPPNLIGTDGRTSTSRTSARTTPFAQPDIE